MVWYGPHLNPPTPHPLTPLLIFFFLAPQGRESRSFVFDTCYGPGSTQEDVFVDTENLIQSAFDGFNVAIFAYGQTGR